MSQPVAGRVKTANRPAFDGGSMSGLDRVALRWPKYRAAARVRRQHNGPRSGHTGADKGVPRSTGWTWQKALRGGCWRERPQGRHAGRSQRASPEDDDAPSRRSWARHKWRGGGPVSRWRTNRSPVPKIRQRPLAGSYRVAAVAPGIWARLPAATCAARARRREGAPSRRRPWHRTPPSGR